MKTQQRNLIFMAALLLSTLALAESPAIHEPVAADSTSTLTGKEMLGITPNQYKEGGFTGYELLKNKGIGIEFTLISPKFGGSNQLSGIFFVWAGDSGKLSEQLMMQTNIDIYNPDRIGGYAVGLTNSGLSSSSTATGSMTVISPGHFMLYGQAGFNSEVLAFGDLVKGRATPAGLNLEVTDKYASIFYNAFCPWPKNDNYPIAKCVVSPSGNKVYNMTITGASKIEITP